MASVWVMPLGQTPRYLDPQSQEALHEVDVSGMALLFSFGQAPEGEARELGMTTAAAGGGIRTPAAIVREIKERLGLNQNG